MKARKAKHGWLLTLIFQLSAYCICTPLYWYLSTLLKRKHISAVIPLKFQREICL